jgi:hypothetical protein
MKYKMSSATLPTGPYPVYASYTAPAGNKVETSYNGEFGIVASYVGAMHADASANVAALYQEKVTINGVQFIYDVSLSAANTFTLLNAFGVTGWGPNAHPAQFGVRVVDVSGLATVLKSAIEAVGGATSQDYSAHASADAPANLMNNDLNNEVYKQLMVKIQADGLINSVEEQYADTWYRVDASSGAWDTAKHYNADDGDFAQAKGDCDLLFLQIPSDTLYRYTDASEEPLSNALLLAPGDKITFVWDVDTTLKASVTNAPDSNVLNATAYDTAGSAATKNGAVEGAVAQADPYTGSLNLNVPPVRVAVRMHLTDDAGSVVAGSKPRFVVGPTALRASKA